MKKNSYIKVNGFIYGVVAKCLCFFLSLKYNIKYENYKEVRKVKGPITLICNHVGFWDPFIIAYPLKQKIQYITSDNIFRSKILKNVMKWLGSIPKTKFMEDRLSLINVLRTSKNGGSIGLFPEGRRSFDGASIEIIETTAKLIKKMGVPLVGAKIKGGFLSLPRWAKYKRRGKILIDYTLLLTADEVKNLPEEEMLQIIKEHLRFNEYEYQSNVMTEFYGKRPAEDLEQLLYVCPKCKTVASLESDDDKFFCKSCGYSVIMSRYGFFEKDKDEPIFKNPHLQNEWQKEFTLGFINAKPNVTDVIFKDKNADFHIGYKASPLEPLFSGDFILTKEALIFTCIENGTETSRKKFLIKDIKGLNIQNKEKFEFYHDDTLYRVGFESTKVSLFKYFVAINILTES
ncbi:MAG: hypothetical protein CR988_05165 [Treponema sp.]|nr:MAG: hypothetical protein CR988_05165 [Treponema sp.]